MHQVKEGSLSQHSYPTLPQRRSGGRRLPPTPRNPSTLNFGVVGAVVMATQRHPRDRSPSSAGQHPAAGLMMAGGAGGGGTINFPKLSPSPTHPPRTHHLPAIPSSRLRPAGGGGGGSDRLPPLPPGARPPLPSVGIHNEEDEDDYLPAARIEPLSFEQALALGRGSGGVGRQLPSPMPNGYKPGHPQQQPQQQQQLAGGPHHVEPIQPVVLAGVDRSRLLGSGDRAHPPLNQRTLSNQRGVTQHHAEERRSDSDEDDWC